VNAHIEQRVGDRKFALLVTLAYALFVTWLSSLHEVWRDEVVAMSMVADSHSFGEVLQRMQGFGHPSLWYALLYVGFKIYPHYTVLKVVNLSISVLAVFLVLDRSTFNRLQKTLFVGGFFPLYFYPILNRNYGISLLLVALLCTLYRDRWKKFVPFCAVLFLLANAHTHSLILTLAVVVSLAFEMIDRRREDVARIHKGALAAGSGIVLLGVAVALMAAMPEESSVVYSGNGRSLQYMIASLGRSLIVPGQHFPELFLVKSWIFSNALIFCIYLLLYRKPPLFVLFLASVCGLSLFADIVYPTYELRYQGALYLVVILIFWIERYVRPDERMAAVKPLWLISERVAKWSGALLVLVLSLELGMAYPAVRDEILRPYSSSRRLAEMIQANPSLKDAIIIGIPSANLEALPYYLSNPIYLIAEDKFERYRQLADVGRRIVTLEDVLGTARMLEASYDKPVMILLGDEIAAGGPYEFKFTHGFRTFRYSHHALARFRHQTKFLGRFDGALTDENYSAFLLREAPARP
jgi:hypothetical protein